jgi:iron complex transport system substrate-binding protein
MPARYPERIVCLTEETTETLYLLGEERRIVGISGYTVRPARARIEKPKVSSFLSAKIGRILELKPDLVLGFSDLQADIARDLAKAGMNVMIFNQRSVGEILSMILTLSAMVGAAEKGRQLVSELERNLGSIRESAARFAKTAARLFRGVGRADDQRHPLGERARRDRRRRGHLFRAFTLSGGKRPRGFRPFTGH